MPVQRNKKYWELWLGRERLSLEWDKIDASTKLQQYVRAIEHEYGKCRLRYFCPHGDGQYGQDCGFQLVSVAEFINDREHTFGMLVSPNQVGKTTAVTIKKILRLVPTKPDWEIYTKYGIKYVPWRGPINLVVIGYSKGTIMETLWPEYQKWLPVDELRDLAPSEYGGTRVPNWLTYPRVDLKCGSRLMMFGSESSASIVAGLKADEVHADEQQPIEWFNELDERGRTRDGVMWDCAFTPHKVQGRASTGIEGWLYDMWIGRNTRGHKIIRARIGVEDVPDRIYSKKQKEMAYQKHVVNPKKDKDLDAIREGEARYYGIFQRMSEIFYPEIDPELHFVNWTYDDIEDKGWTHYRTIDYGFSNPTSCGYWAVSPAGDYFRYDEYYVAGKDATEHAPGIISRCGNERILTRKFTDEKTGTIYNQWKEVPKKQKYVRTWLDWHCFHSSDGIGRTVGFFFGINGLEVVASTKHKQDVRAQNMRAFLKIDPQRPHMVTGKPGAPRMYISRQCTKWIWEWQHCLFDTRKVRKEQYNEKEVKRNVNDHAIDDSEYMACSGARYLGDYDKDTENDEFEPVSKMGGY